MHGRGSVEALLGVAAAKSPLALANAIEAGLPVSALQHFAEIAAPNDKNFRYRIVPKGTLRRRLRSNGRLKPCEGDRVARLAKVFSFALEIYGEPGRVIDFLSRPHPMLGGKPPFDVALKTSTGADLVTNVLGRAAYGGAV